MADTILVSRGAYVVVGSVTAYLVDKPIALPKNQEQAAHFLRNNTNVKKSTIDAATDAYDCENGKVFELNGDFIGWWQHRF